MKGILLTFFASFCFITANAQALSQSKEITSVYTIQLGKYEDKVKQADFEAIRSYAYIYKRDGFVFAGNFSTEEAAEPFLAKIKAKGFEDATLVSRSLKTGKTVYIVQIATKNAGEPITWKNYARVGELFTIPNNGQVRIVHGAYQDKNDANMKLKQVIEMGFTDAFVRSIKDLQLNTITEFEVGDKSVLTPEPEPTAPKNIPKTVPATTDIAVTTPKNIPKTVSTTTDVVATTPKSVLKSYNAPPAIATKRKSVIKLQDALKDLGLNGGTSDGIFNKQTQVLYDRALKLNRRLATYNELAQKYKGFEGWEDARLLLTMARELSVKDDGKILIADLFNNLPSNALTAKEATVALDWHIALWKKLEIWSTAGQYNDQVYTALKVAYYRTLAHLEDHYSSKGIHGEAGTAASVAVLKTLMGDNFDGFN